MGGGVLAEGEVVQDEHGGAGVFADPGTPGAVGVAAGEVGQDAAGFGESDFAGRRATRCPKACAMWVFLLRRVRTG